MSRFRLVLKILTAVAVISGLIWGGYVLMMGQVFRIHSINVTLDEPAGHIMFFSKIKESMDAKLLSWKGQQLWNVDLEDVLKKVESDLRIKTAKVSRVLPDTLLVTIVPHTPVANVMGDDSNKIYPVARDGELLPAISKDEIFDSPIIRGQEFLRDKSKRLGAIELLLLLPESGMLSQRSVSEIYFDKRKGYYLLLSPTGVEVWAGAEDFSRRLSQATRVLQYLEREKLSGRIIDARFTKKVVVRLRNEP